MEQACPGFFGRKAKNGPRVRHLSRPFREMLADTIQKLHTLKVED